MKITEETNLYYDYFNGTQINLNNKNCFYFENPSCMDKYQVCDSRTEKVVVCAETKEELINYLVNQNATIIENEAR